MNWQKQPDALEAARGWFAGASIGFGLVIGSLIVSSVAELLHPWSWVAAVGIAVGGIVGAVKAAR